ncbi:MAG: hypothetical protein MUW56_13830 [Chryseobacterium sp.]|uniref:hypothetical protein n=1 Tax=Chryseobacterium sp. TaxID=1871047 RepID=UPI0025B95182|nr:hypothetical protein [Chryseobacterium sp.]MCJ7934667.1 hypothetical protein [Chryseobacterium sp.]
MPYILQKTSTTVRTHFIEDYYVSKRPALKEWTETFSNHEQYKDIPVKAICDAGCLKNS